MTLDEFRSTRVDCPNIGEALSDECMIGESGYLYDNAYFIVRERDSSIPGDYSTLIGKHWYSGSLEEMERQLWECFYEASHEETTNGT